MLREQKERFKVVLVLIIGLISVFIIICIGYHYITGRPIIIETGVVQDHWNAGDFIINTEENNIMTCIATGMTFGNNIGRISWEKGAMIFEGDAEESARVFFEKFLKFIIDKYIEDELKKEETIINEPEMILFEFTSSGEWARTFKPKWFLKINNTDLSRCFIDDRLRLDLNGEIYWIRLEAD